MEWAMVETLTQWSVRRVTEMNRQTELVQDPVERKPSLLAEKLTWIEKHSADPDARAYAAAVRECVKKWQVERHCLAHGMVVVGKDGKWMETDQGKKLSFDRIPAAVEHAEVTSRLAYVLFLHLCGETITDELLDQPVIRLNEGEKVEDTWEFQRRIEDC